MGEYLITELPARPPKNLVVAKSAGGIPLKRASLDKRRISGTTSGISAISQGGAGMDVPKSPVNSCHGPANFAATSDVNQWRPGSVSF